ncbi:MAG: hypothetical protein CMJ32_11955 [Phycisphaerae bacterium]|nr:hypothetical protein [Phycisphaerae bacterium]
MIHLLASMTLLLTCSVACHGQEPQATPPGTEQELPAVDPKSKLPLHRQAIADRSYVLEVAGTFAARRRGLGGRKRIEPGRGMIFVHPEPGYRRYWMYDCTFPMEIIFLDQDGRITAMHRMKPEPPRKAGESESAYTSRLKRYSSRRKALYAIELEPGSIDSLKIKIGQVIPIDHAKMRGFVPRSEGGTGPG